MSLFPKWLAFKKSQFQTFQLHGEEGPEVLSKIDAVLKLLKN